MNPLLKQAAFISIDGGDKLICIDLGLVAVIISSPNTPVGGGKTTRVVVRLYLLKTGKYFNIFLETPTVWWDKANGGGYAKVNGTLCTLLTHAFPKRLVAAVGGDSFNWACRIANWGIL